MNLYELLDNMYENKEFRVKKKDLCKVKSRLKCLHEDCLYARAKSYNDPEWIQEFALRKASLYNYLLCMLDNGLITEYAFDRLEKVMFYIDTDLALRI